MCMVTGARNSLTCGDRPCSSREARGLARSEGTMQGFGRLVLAIDGSEVHDTGLVSFAPQRIDRLGRYWMASARWGVSMLLLPARSAMVR